MGLSCRRFLVDPQDRLVRLKNSTFDPLVRDPAHHTMPAMAGQRIRMAELVVELANRIPIRVVRRVYVVIAFDEIGRVDTERFLKQQWALAESALDPALRRGKGDERILDAASRFVAQGGRWRPSATLSQLIDNAALGIVP
jgi:hypothetical protein